jgi:hypothetical protein
MIYNGAKFPLKGTLDAMPDTFGTAERVFPDWAHPSLEAGLSA